MILSLPRRFNHLFDDVIRCWLVGISHAEIDDVFAVVTSLELEALDLRKDIGRKSLEPIKII